MLHQMAAPDGDIFKNSPTNNQALRQMAVHCVACEEDNILNEMIKAFSETHMGVLTKIFNIVLQSGHMPHEWVIGIIKRIYKNKGEINDPDNYRGITLLSCFGKNSPQY